MIHAGLTIALPRGASLPRGFFVGAVMLVGVQECDDGHAWILADPWRMKRPMPGKGRLGFFAVPADVAAALPLRYRVGDLSVR